MPLYLLTFALAFGRHSQAVGAIATRALPLLVIPLALVMMTKVRAPLAVIVVLHLAAFAVIAFNCHAELAKDRPAPSRLTEFYFWVSFGGMVGGLFNTLAAPFLFDSIVEYPLMVLLGCLMFRASGAAVASGRAAADVVLPLVVGGVTAGICVAIGRISRIAAPATGAILGAGARHIHSATAPAPIWVVRGGAAPRQLGIRQCE